MYAYNVNGSCSKYIINSFLSVPDIFSRDICPHFKIDCI